MSSEQKYGDDMPDTTLVLDRETGCIRSTTAPAFHDSARPETIKDVLLEHGELGQEEIRKLVGGEGWFDSATRPSGQRQLFQISET